MRTLSLLSLLFAVTLAAACADEPARSDAGPALCDLDGGVMTDEDGGVITERATPAPDCLAPCIWELIKSCNPAMCCYTTTTSNTTNSWGCYSDGSVRWKTSTDGSTYTTTVSRADGSICYKITTTEDRSLYMDGEDNLVATVLGSAGTFNAYCEASHEVQAFYPSLCAAQPPTGCVTVNTLPPICN